MIYFLYQARIIGSLHCICSSLICPSLVYATLNPFRGTAQYCKDQFASKLVLYRFRSSWLEVRGRCHGCVGRVVSFRPLDPSLLTAVDDPRTGAVRVLLWSLLG